METAGEGGPWGMALLAAYMQRRGEGETLEDYLEHRVFVDAKSSAVEPDPAGVAGFHTYIDRYRACIPAEQAASALR